MSTRFDRQSADGEDMLILIDERNRPLGSAEKHAAHRSGLLHRAFSIFLFDARGRLLLQRRAADKYHSGGLWANTCCGHPRPGESAASGAARRLREELGVSSALSFAFHARYRVPLDHGMIENELVHIFAGRLPDGPIRPNPMEADATALVSFDELETQIARAPERYAYWLRHYIAVHGEELRDLARGALLRRKRVVPGRALALGGASSGPRRVRAPNAASRLKAESP